MSQITEAVELVAKFFEGDYKKTFDWFAITNPLLGNVTPSSMVATNGDCPKLLKFIKTQLSENYNEAGDNSEGLHEYKNDIWVDGKKFSWNSLVSLVKGWLEIQNKRRL